MAYPTIPTPGGDRPANVYGRATALLSLMYRDGLIPEVSVYGRDDPDSDPEVLYINGEAAGKTDAEVTDFIWRLSDCWRTNGFLFDAQPVVA